MLGVTLEEGVTLGDGVVEDEGVTEKLGMTEGVTLGEGLGIVLGVIKQVFSIFEKCAAFYVSCMHKMQHILWCFLIFLFSINSNN